MNLLKRLTIRARLLIIVVGSSLALVCLGLTGLHYLRAMGHGDATGLYREAMRANLGLLAFFITCGAGTGMLISWSISTSLARITGRVHDLAEGEGDLTRRIAIGGRDELGAMAGYIDTFIHKAQAAVAHSAATADETARSSQDLLGFSRSLADTVATQCGLAERSSTRMAEVARDLDLTEAMSVATAETLATTESLLGGFVGTLNHVGRTVIAEGAAQARMAGHMQDLRRDATGIHEVLGILAEIAGQTNLLALNASIEAAHARESGKGFAVVAEQIRKLAEKTQDSLASINASVRAVVDGIEAMAAETARASEQMLGVSAAARGMMESADAAGTKLKGSVETCADLVRKTTAIAARTKDLMETMNRLADLSSHNREAANGVDGVSANLAVKSEDLRRSLGQFRVA